MIITIASMTINIIFDVINVHLLHIFWTQCFTLVLWNIFFFDKHSLITYLMIDVCGNNFCQILNIKTIYTYFLFFKYWIMQVYDIYWKIPFLFVGKNWVFINIHIIIKILSFRLKFLFYSETFILLNPIFL